MPKEKWVEEGITRDREMEVLSASFFLPPRQVGRTSQSHTWEAPTFFMLECGEEDISWRLIETEFFFSPQCRNRGSSLDTTEPLDCAEAQGHFTRRIRLSVHETFLQYLALPLWRQRLPSVSVQHREDVRLRINRKAIASIG